LKNDIVYYILGIFILSLLAFIVLRVPVTAVIGVDNGYLDVANKVNTKSYISKFAQQDNGNEHANIDCSSTECIFKLQPPSNETWIISRLLFQLVDDDDIDNDYYGADITLSNGIALKIVKNGIVVANLTNSQPIMVNLDWAKFCYDVSIFNFESGWGYVDNCVSARWTFSKSGTYIKLNGSTNDSINVYLNDDFTGLVDHTFLYQGYVN